MLSGSSMVVVHFLFLIVSDRTRSKDLVHMIWIIEDSSQMPFIRSIFVNYIPTRCQLIKEKTYTVTGYQISAMGKLYGNLRKVT